MPTEMELTLEQTQQGVSYEVSNIRVNSFTMKMEILLEPTSNKLMVEHAEYDESNTYVLERFNTTAGNPVKKILLKLNLSDHRLLIFYKEEGEIDNDILQIEDEILREKLLNVNILFDKIEALNLIPSITFVLEYPSSSPIPVVDSDFLIEEVDTFLVSRRLDTTGY
ncbi:hypothetical protein Tco_1174840 [Tanacetum coccineum]